MKFNKYIFMFIASILLLFSFVNWIWWFDLSNNILNNNQSNVVTNMEDDVLRSWVWDLWWWVEWIATSSWTDYQWWFVDFLSKIINYFLAILSLVVLAYLLYHWFLMVTAAWNDDKYNKWASWVKYALIALLWIWVSWFFISLIFTVINMATGG